MSFVNTFYKDAKSGIVSLAVICAKKKISSAQYCFTNNDLNSNLILLKTTQNVVDGLFLQLNIFTDNDIKNHCFEITFSDISLLHYIYTFPLFVAIIAEYKSINIDTIQNEVCAFIGSVDKSGNIIDDGNIYDMVEACKKYNIIKNFCCSINHEEKIKKEYDKLIMWKNFVNIHYFKNIVNIATFIKVNICDDNNLLSKQLVKSFDAPMEKPLNESTKNAQCKSEKLIINKNKTNHNNFIMDTRLNINIAIIGTVSAGKSTLLNTLFVEKFSDMKMKRTTMLPQIYQETTNKNLLKSSETIRKENQKINNEYIKRTQNGVVLKLEDCIEIFYYTDKIYDFQKLKESVFLNIYDIPGINDAKTKDAYYCYLENNFYKFDIVIFMVDINSALNTSDETDLLKKIGELTKNELSKKKKVFIITCGNKCDYMEWNDNKLDITDEEYKEQYDQLNNTILKVLNEKNIPKDYYYVTPIGLEDAYIYRCCKKYCEKVELDQKHIDKLGTNEYGFLLSKIIKNRFTNL